MSDNAAIEPWPIDDLIEWAELGEPTRIVRAMPWATVVVWERAGTTTWGKAVCPGFAVECRLLPLLAAHAADCVLAPIRVDAARGLLLLPDGGPTIESRRDVASWTDVLVGYAEAQRALIGRERALLDAGCVDLRPRQAVECLAAWMDDGIVAVDAGLLEWLGGTAEELGDAVPATVQHDDLNPSNVLLDGRIIDWGDACLAHPFASLLTALLPGTDRRPGTPTEQLAVRDAYLASWIEPLGLRRSSATDMDWLRRQAELATRLAPIGRIDRWLAAPPAALIAYPDAIDRWLRHLRDDMASGH